jgi:DNA polymerase III delta subunit
MFYHVVSQDSFLARTFINGLVEEGKAKNPSSRSHFVEVKDADSLAAAFSFFEGQSLFSEAKTLVIRSEKTLATELSPFSKTLAKLSTDPLASLVIWEDSSRLDTGSDLRKFGAKKTVFPKLKGSRLEAWVFGEAKRQGITLSPDLVLFLIELCEGETARLFQEIAKLSSYKPASTLSLKDAAFLSLSFSGPSFFDFVDALLSQHPRGAIFHLLEEEASGTPPVRHLASLISLFRTLVLLKEKKTAKSASLLGKQNPYWVRRLEQTSRALSPEILKAAFRHLADLDWKAKTGQVDLWLSLEAFTLAFSTRKQTSSSSAGRHYER